MSGRRQAVGRTLAGVLIAFHALAGEARGPASGIRDVTPQEKKDFIALVRILPMKGEFFTDDSITKAIPQTRVLLALDEKDLAGIEIYRFLALSRGILDREGQRSFGVQRFAEIAHPEIKMGWAVMLFEENAASPEIVVYLKKALGSKREADLLAEMLGPEFAEFKKRVERAKVD